MTNAQKFKDTFGFEPTLFVDCPIGIGGWNVTLALKNPRVIV